MMRIIVAEDYQRKSDDLCAAVSEVVPDAVIDTATSYRGTLDLIMTNSYQLAVLDITMPDFDERGSASEIMHYAGKEILMEMLYQNRFCPTVMVTGFGVIGNNQKRVTFVQLRSDLLKLMGAGQFDMIAYKGSNPEWKTQFTNAIRRVLSYEQTKPAGRRGYQSKTKKNNRTAPR